MRIRNKDYYRRRYLRLKLREQTDPVFKMKRQEQRRLNKRRRRMRMTFEEKRNKKLKEQYGIDSTEYSFLYQKQNGLCAICSNPETTNTSKSGGKINSLAVDHCHSSNKIRGLLCQRCNIGIGYFKNNPIFLKQAIAYLSSSSPLLVEQLDLSLAVSKA